ncbi:MAG: ABC transporter permease [Candidatus Roizmanbacteria bacterium]
MKNITQIFLYWELIKHLSLREIKVRYKQSFLGFFWVILNPFMQMLIMSFIFSTILKITKVGVPYPVFIYAGLLPWTFFANSLGASLSILIENSAIIKKIYFPREVLVLSTVLAKAFDFFLASILFLLMMLWFHLPFTWYMLLFFPIFLVQLIFILGIALMLSAFNLFYRDIQYLLTLVITMWFYVTPVIYATEFFPEHYRWIFKINPMSVFINAYREVLLAQGSLNWSSLFIGVCVSLIVFCLGYWIFKKLEGMFADIA